MSLLLLDSGNTRLKWGLQREPYRRQQAFAAGGIIELSRLSDANSPLMRLFEALKLAGLAPLIYACNVAGSVVERQIRSAARHAGLKSVTFVRSSVAAAGVRNGYKEVWRLGADRWASLVGAHHEFPNMDLCIVGIGTALTIDLMDASGRHVGGSIIPGPRLMIESLLARTAGIRRRAGGLSAATNIHHTAAELTGVSPSMFAHDTQTGLRAGARHACAAAIEHARTEAGQQLGRRPRLVLAGGAAEAVAPLLRSPYRQENDLVLRGLAVIASSAASRKTSQLKRRIA
jgi:type III pantothenate kinase